MAANLNGTDCEICVIRIDDRRCLLTIFHAGHVPASQSVCGGVLDAVSMVTIPGWIPLFGGIGGATVVDVAAAVTSVVNNWNPVDVKSIIHNNITVVVQCDQ